MVLNLETDDLRMLAYEIAEVNDVEAQLCLSVLRQSAKMYQCSQCDEGCKHEREMRKHAISEHRMQFDKRSETVLPYATPEMAEAEYLCYRRGQLSAHRCHRLDVGLYVPRYLQEYRHHHVQSSSWPTPEKGEGRTWPKNFVKCVLDISWKFVRLDL